MRIYVNEQYEILSIDGDPKLYYEVFEVEQTKTDMFGSLCDTVINGYKYEPQYAILFNEDGSNAVDEESGELLYKLDEEGNKIINGYSCYPFVDYSTLMLIQKQYEDSQQQVQALNAQVAYLQMMSGIAEEA